MSQGAGNMFEVPAWNNPFSVSEEKCVSHLWGTQHSTDCQNVDSSA